MVREALASGIAPPVFVGFDFREQQD
jgi:hypothetical protein